MTGAHATTIEILLVEDSPADIVIAREALIEARPISTMHIAEDGVEALDFLHKRGKFSASPKPDLILLDLNLPRKNGREVLAEIKAEEHLKHIPVVILTASNAEEDIAKSYNLHANCYVVKPVEFESFARAVQSILHFWFRVAMLPSSAKKMSR